MSKASNYRRRHHQPSGDVGSCVPNCYYGYFEFPPENPSRYYLSVSQLHILANQAIQDGNSFQEFRDVVGLYIDKPNFKWHYAEKDMKVQFDRDLKEIEHMWPKHLK